MNFNNDCNHGSDCWGIQSCDVEIQMYYELHCGYCGVFFKNFEDYSYDSNYFTHLKICWDCNNPED